VRLHLRVLSLLQQQRGRALRVAVVPQRKAQEPETHLVGATESFRLVEQRQRTRDPVAVKVHDRREVQALASSLNGRREPSGALQHQGRGAVTTARVGG